MYILSRPSHLSLCLVTVCFVCDMSLIFALSKDEYIVCKVSTHF